MISTIIWWTGLTIWISMILAIAAIFILGAFRAIVATEIIAWQYIALLRGAERVEGVTWKSAWMDGFYHGWNGRTRSRYWKGCPPDIE